MDMKLYVKRLKKNSQAFLPRYMTEGASGMDLYASVEKDIVIMPGERSLIPTGISIAIPDSFEGQIRARSGLAIKNGIGVLNGPGTIDSDYRGEICVILINLGDKPFRVKNGDRIAQLVISKVFRPVIEEVDDLPPSRRQDGGFGHTGV